MNIIPQEIKRRKRFKLESCSYEARKKFRDNEWRELAAVLQYYGIQEVHFGNECFPNYLLVVHFDNYSEHLGIHRIKLILNYEVEIEVMARNDDGCFYPYLLNRIDLLLGEVGALAEYLIDSFEEMWCKNSISK